MSDEENASAEAPAKPATQVRRISNPRPRKTPKVAKETEAPSEAASSEEAPPASPVESGVSTEAVSSPETPDADDRSADDWEEVETTVSGGQASSNDPKRKRRRRKGKGSQNPNGQGDDASVAESSDGVVTVSPPVAAPASKPQPSRPSIDSEQLAKKAWKIFLAEVSEEGVALIGDQDARELSRRCFRLAEIFLEERSRRR